MSFYVINLLSITEAFSISNMLFIYLNVAVIIVIQKLFDRKLSEKKKALKKLGLLFLCS